MTIDIIDLTDPQYSQLNAVQLSMVRAAQGKKDKILAGAQTEKDQLFRKMAANGIARSSAYSYAVQEIDEKAQSDVDVIKQDLLYQIAYENWQWEGNESGPYRYPQNPNYNLTPSQRFLEVRTYYMSVTSDPDARLRAFEGDTLAKSYLGEFYVTLYDLLASYC
ncbi:MAG: hypothetical protein HFE27_03990 [Clostridia bacterium]|jgi:hypothetical protein|nr:hypothetical protein [Clostridia bacterium]